MKPVTHWVGGVQTQRAQYIAGWVACCSGDKCRKLTAEAATTVAVGEVTCRACLRVMRRDVTLLAKLATNAGELGFPDLACMLAASAPVSLAALVCCWCGDLFEPNPDERRTRHGPNKPRHAKKRRS